VTLAMLHNLHLLGEFVTDKDSSFFSALTLLFGQQEEHLACKRICCKKFALKSGQ